MGGRDAGELHSCPGQLNWEFSFPFLLSARKFRLPLGFAPSLYSKSAFYTFSLDPHNLPGQGPVFIERLLEGIELVSD